MPEGDTVHRAARRMNEHLAGRVVLGFDIRVPGSATVDLSGQSVHEVVARGKHLLHRIGDATLHSHLKMEGEWALVPRGAHWPKPGFRARAVIQVPGMVAVGFDLAMVEVLRTRDEHRVVGHLGPDPLGADWNLERAAANVAADPRPIHVALQDQRRVAGFGNEYASELLFLRGVHPETPATQVDTVALLTLGARTIRRNVDLPVRNFTGVARRGQDRWVYGREHQPCRRCGAPIRRGALGADPTRERVVYWCPVCQPV